MAESSPARPGLGTQLRHVLDLLDSDVQVIYAGLGIDYRPRFTPIVRALVAVGPMPIRHLAGAASVTHSAASQTVARMASLGLVTLEPGGDARERVVHLTDKARSLLPTLERQWAATNDAADALDAELPFPLSAILTAAAEALERRPFRARIAAAALARRGARSSGDARGRMARARTAAPAQATR